MKGLAFCSAWVFPPTRCALGTTVALSARVCVVAPLVTAQRLPEVNFLKGNTDIAGLLTMERVQRTVQVCEILSSYLILHSIESAGSEWVSYWEVGL